MSRKLVKESKIRIPDLSKLRDYQKECVDKIAACESGSHLVVLPTGAGKTFCFSHIPRRGRVLILSHRDELVHQPEKYYINEPVFDENGKEVEKCTFGVEQASESSNGEEVVSASVQSLVRRLHRFDPDEFDMIITDEAHHAVAPSYQKIYDYFNFRVHIGFTATPDRSDKHDLHKIFDDILYIKDMKWGITSGFLTDIECYQVNIGYNLNGVGKSMGDYKIDALSTAMMNPECIDAVVDAYNNLRKGQTIIFGCNVAHCQAMAQKIPGSKVVTGSTSSAERAQIIQDFTDRKIPCLINCMVFTEGTDIPLIETVIMARPTMNQSLYMQMLGRGLRLYPGKESLRFIDCVGVSKTKPVNVGHLFGLNFEVIPPSKTKRLNGVCITEMQSTIEALCDGPDSWIRGYEIVKIFEEDNEVDFRNIAFTPMANDSLYLSAGGLNITIPQTDALGQTHAILMFVDENGHKKKEELAPGSLQEVIDNVYTYLLSNWSEHRKLWDAEIVRGWGSSPASEKQIEYMQSLAEMAEEPLTDINIVKLTKFEVSCIIDHLKMKYNSFSPAKKRLIKSKKASKEKNKPAAAKGIERPSTSFYGQKRSAAASEWALSMYKGKIDVYTEGNWWS